MIQKALNAQNRLMRFNDLLCLCFRTPIYYSVDPYGGYLAYLFQIFTDSLSDATLFSIFTYTEPEDRCVVPDTYKLPVLL